MKWHFRIHTPSEVFNVFNNNEAESQREMMSKIFSNSNTYYKFYINDGYPIYIKSSDVTAIEISQHPFPISER